MAGPTLDGVDLRIERAKDQLAVLDDAVTPFLEGKRGAFVGELDRDTGEYVFRIGGDQPPLYWGITVGEIAHELRAALDNLLWQLVVVRGNTPDGRNQFPITESKGAWDSEIKKRERLQGIEPGDVAFIQAAQPYHHGPYWSKRHLLALLQHLNNIDKHRVLHAAFVAMGYHLIEADIWLPLTPDMLGQVKNLPPDGRQQVSFSTRLPSFAGARDVAKIEQFVLRAGMSDDPTEIVRRFVANGPNPEVKMENEPEIQISLCDISRPVTVVDLRRIVGRVERIVSNFRPLF